MKFQQFFIALLLLSTTCLGQAKQELTFQKRGKKRIISLELPTELTILKKNGGEIYRSEVYSRNDSTLFFRVHYYKSPNGVGPSDTYTKEDRNRWITNIFNSDTMTIATNIHDIQKATFHTTSAKQTRYKLRFWGLGALFIASGGLTIYSIASSIDGGFGVGDGFAVASFPISFTLWITTAKLHLKTERWDIR